MLKINLQCFVTFFPIVEKKAIIKLLFGYQTQSLLILNEHKHFRSVSEKTL